jgi:hypothetical protein
MPNGDPHRSSQSMDPPSHILGFTFLLTLDRKASQKAERDSILTIGSGDKTFSVMVLMEAFMRAFKW